MFLSYPTSAAGACCVRMPVGGQWDNVTTIVLFHTFIHSGYLYSAPSRNLVRGARSPAMAKEKCLKELAERRRIVPLQQAEYKREFIPSGGANDRESSMLFKHRAGPRNQELTMSLVGS